MLESPCRTYDGYSTNVCTVQWSGCGPQPRNVRSWVSQVERMALLGKEVGREETTNYCPCVGPETFNTSHTQKGLKLGRKLVNAEVAYVFHPDHSFSKTKSKEVSCGEKTLGQGWGPRVATLSTSGPANAWSQPETWEWVVTNGITCPNQKELAVPPETWARHWPDP